MADAEKSGARRGLDATGLLLLAALAVGAVAVGAALIYAGYFTPWGLVIFLAVCGAFLAVGLPSHVTTAPKNTLVHGAARPATETEAQAAARGAVKARDLHEQQFPD
jgi:hypothetical protein